MCGRFTLRTPARDLVEIFELLREPELSPRYNIAPTQNVAVILPVQPGRRVTKTIAGYAPEVCGPNGWVPISDPFQDLSMVVAGVQGAFAPGGFLPITPGDSVIKLRCPRCQRGYDVHADYLPIDHSATCPHCGTVSPALKSIGYNEPAGVF
jgi:hypothetical protein